MSCRAEEEEETPTIKLKRTYNLYEISRMLCLDAQLSVQSLCVLILSTYRILALSVRLDSGPAGGFPDATVSDCTHFISYFESFSLS